MSRGSEWSGGRRFMEKVTSGVCCETSELVVTGGEGTSIQGWSRARLADKVALQDWMTSSRYARCSTKACLCRDLQALGGTCRGRTGPLADAGKLRSEIEAPVRRHSDAIVRTHSGEPSKQHLRFSTTCSSRLDRSMVAKGRPEATQDSLFLKRNAPSSAEDREYPFNY